MKLGWYNGFSPNERLGMARAGGRLLRAQLLAPLFGTCELCGDPESLLDLHAENYSRPYSWVPPAVYRICRLCHRNHLHRRFSNPLAWLTFLAHVRRGGYARDVTEVTTHRELNAYRNQLVHGTPRPLRVLRSWTRPSSCWFDELSLDATLATPEGAIRHRFHAVPLNETTGASTSAR